MQHPDYPIEFKPAIAAYDWDQTYDILGFSYLPQGLNFLVGLCNIPVYETLAIDRFTPYDYLWAINYSDHLYTFVSYFNYCPNNSIARRKAIDIDDREIKINNNPIWIDEFNYFNNFLSYDNLSYFITIPKGPVKITWLTNDGYPQGLAWNIFTVNQCFVSFNFAQDTQIDLLTLKEDFKDTFCANSLVFSQLINDQWIEFTPQGINHNYLLYSDIQGYFWEVQQALIAYFDYVHTTYGYIIVNESNPILNEKKIIADAMPLRTYIKSIYENIDYSFADYSFSYQNMYPLAQLFNYTQSPLQIIYDYFPFYLYQLCFLQRANNNKWGLGVQLQDIGFNPKPNKFLNTGSFLSFNAYKSHIAQNEITFNQQFRTNFLVYEGAIFPSETVGDLESYAVNLDIPKNSYYLWDYPFFDLIQNWQFNNIISFYYFQAGNDLSENRKFTVAIQSLYRNFYLSAFSTLSFNTRFDKSFPSQIGIQGAARPTVYYSLAHFKKNNRFISNFSYIKEIKNSIYEIQAHHNTQSISDGNYNDVIYNYENIFVKIHGKIHYAIFDIANQLNPNDFLSFQYLGGYGVNKDFTTGINGAVWTNIYGNDVIFSDNFDNSIEFELWTQSEYENLYNYGIISDSDYLIYLQNLKIQAENNMVDSVRVKEIHSCLGASEFSYINNDPTTPIYMHIARKVDYIAKALGLAFNGDGSLMDIRQSKALENGETIPAGWQFGRFGRNEGNNLSNNAQQGGKSSEERLGIVYDVRSNKFITNPASGEEDIKQGGYILCESIPQMLHIMLDDLDRALGLQTLGAIAITNQNYNDDYNGGDLSIKTPYYKYNGLGDAFVEVMHTLADTHKQAFQANIGSLKSQAITIEILGALGVGCLEKTIVLDIDDQPVKIFYPGFNGLTPSITDLHMWTLTNQSFLNEVIS